MPKYNFMLNVILQKEYTIEAADKNDAEIKAIEDFKSKHKDVIVDEYNSFGEGFRIVGCEK